MAASLEVDRRVDRPAQTVSDRQKAVEEHLALEHSEEEQSNLARKKNTFSRSNCN